MNIPNLPLALGIYTYLHFKFIYLFSLKYNILILVHLYTFLLVNIYWVKKFKIYMYILLLAFRQHKDGHIEPFPFEAKIHASMHMASSKRGKEKRKKKKKKIEGEKVKKSWWNQWPTLYI